MSGGPWELSKQLEDGDPGAIEAMAAEWTRAADEADRAMVAAARASAATGAGALLDGTMGHNIAAAVTLTGKQLGDNALEYRLAATTLTRVAASLTDNTSSAQREITDLEADLAQQVSSLGRAVTDNENRANAQLAAVEAGSPQAADIINSARATDSRLVNDAQAAIDARIESARKTITGFIEVYEKVLTDGQQAVRGISPRIDGALNDADIPDPEPAPPPPANGTPAEVNEWWDGLNETQQQDLIENQPDVIGSMNGVPAEDRDQANRIVLSRQRAELATYVAANAGLPVEERNDAEFQEKKLLLEQLDRLNEQINRSGTEEGKAYLLDVDTAAPNGQAIVSIGNPDLAANVATVVPGTNSGLNDSSIYIDKARDIARASGPGSAVISWVGYEAPQNLGAASGSYAEQGARPLMEFQEGLRETHVGERSHNTVIGHSYGGVVVGEAARRYGLDVDEMVFLASPGTSANDASNDVTGLGIAPNRVWATMGDEDFLRVEETFDRQFDPDDKIPERSVYGTEPHLDKFGGLVYPTRGGHFAPFEGESLETLGDIVNGSAARVDR